MDEGIQNVSDCPAVMGVLVFGDMVENQCTKIVDESVVVILTPKKDNRSVPRNDAFAIKIHGRFPEPNRLQFHLIVHDETCAETRRPNLKPTKVVTYPTILDDKTMNVTAVEIKSREGIVNHRMNTFLAGEGLPNQLEDLEGTNFPIETANLRNDIGGCTT